MPDHPEPPRDVCLYREDLSRQWIVVLRTLGGRMDVFRSARDQRGPADGFAKSLAHMLGCPVTEGDPTETRNPVEDLRRQLAEVTAERDRLKAALLLAIPWIGQHRDGPSWATPEGKRKNQVMSDEAFNVAMSFFPDGTPPDWEPPKFRPYDGGPTYAELEAERDRLQGRVRELLGLDNPPSESHP